MSSGQWRPFCLRRNVLKSSGLLGPLLCGLALAPRQIPHELSHQIVLFYMVGRWGSSTQEGSPSRSRKAPISNLRCQAATSHWEPTRGWCPNRKNRFPLHLKLRLDARQGSSSIVLKPLLQLIWKCRIPVHNVKKIYKFSSYTVHSAYLQSI